VGFGEVEGIRAFCLGVWDGMGWEGRGIPTWRFEHDNAGRVSTMILMNMYRRRSLLFTTAAGVVSTIVPLNG